MDRFLIPDTPNVHSEDETSLSSLVSTIPSRLENNSPEIDFAPKLKFIPENESTSIKISQNLHSNENINHALGKRKSFSGVISANYSLQSVNNSNFRINTTKKLFESIDKLKRASSQSINNVNGNVNDSLARLNSNSAFNNNSSGLNHVLSALHEHDKTIRTLQNALADIEIVAQQTNGSYTKKSILNDTDYSNEIKKLDSDVLNYQQSPINESSIQFIQNEIINQLDSYKNTLSIEHISQIVSENVISNISEIINAQIKIALNEQSNKNSIIDDLRSEFNSFKQNVSEQIESIHNYNDNAPANNYQAFQESVLKRIDSSQELIKLKADMLKDDIDSLYSLNHKTNDMINRISNAHAQYTLKTTSEFENLDQKISDSTSSLQDKINSQNETTNHEFQQLKNQISQLEIEHSNNSSLLVSNDLVLSLQEKILRAENSSENIQQEVQKISFELSNLKSKTIDLQENPKEFLANKLLQEIEELKPTAKNLERFDTRFIQLSSQNASFQTDLQNITLNLIPSVQNDIKNMQENIEVKISKDSLEKTQNLKSILDPIENRINQNENETRDIQCILKKLGDTSNITDSIKNIENKCKKTNDKLKEFSEKNKDCGSKLQNQLTMLSEKINSSDTALEAKFNQNEIEMKNIQSELKKVIELNTLSISENAASLESKIEQNRNDTLAIQKEIMDIKNSQDSPLSRNLKELEDKFNQNEIQMKNIQSELKKITTNHEFQQLKNQISQLEIEHSNNSSLLVSNDLVLSLQEKILRAENSSENIQQEVQKISFELSNLKSKTIDLQENPKEFLANKLLQEIEELKPTAKNLERFDTRFIQLSSQNASFQTDLQNITLNLIPSVQNDIKNMQENIEVKISKDSLEKTQNLKSILDPIENRINQNENETRDIQCILKKLGDTSNITDSIKNIENKCKKTNDKLKEFSEKNKDCGSKLQNQLTMLSEKINSSDTALEAKFNQNEIEMKNIQSELKKVIELNTLSISENAASLESKIEQNRNDTLAIQKEIMDIKNSQDSPLSRNLKELEDKFNQNEIQMKNIQSELKKIIELNTLSISENAASLESKIEQNRNDTLSLQKEIMDIKNSQDSSLSGNLKELEDNFNQNEIQMKNIQSELKKVIEQNTLSISKNAASLESKIEQNRNNNLDIQTKIMEITEKYKNNEAEKADQNASIEKISLSVKKSDDSYSKLLNDFADLKHNINNIKIEQSENHAIKLVKEELDDMKIHFKNLDTDSKKFAAQLNSLITKNNSSPKKNKNSDLNDSKKEYEEQFKKLDQIDILTRNLNEKTENIDFEQIISLEARYIESFADIKNSIALLNIENLNFKNDILNSSKKLDDISNNCKTNAADIIMITDKVLNIEDLFKASEILNLNENLEVLGQKVHDIDSELKKITQLEINHSNLESKYLESFNRISAVDASVKNIKESLESVKFSLTDQFAVNNDMAIKNEMRFKSLQSIVTDLESAITANRNNLVNKTVALENLDQSISEFQKINIESEVIRINAQISKLDNSLNIQTLKNRENSSEIESINHKLKEFPESIQEVKKLIKNSENLFGDMIKNVKTYAGDQIQFCLKDSQTQNAFVIESKLDKAFADHFVIRDLRLKLNELFEFNKRILSMENDIHSQVQDNKTQSSLLLQNQTKEINAELTSIKESLKTFNTQLSKLDAKFDEDQNKSFEISEFKLENSDKMVEMILNNPETIKRFNNIKDLMSQQLSIFRKEHINSELNAVKSFEEESRKNISFKFEQVDLQIKSLKEFLTDIKVEKLIIQSLESRISSLEKQFKVKSQKEHKNEGINASFSNRNISQNMLESSLALNEGGSVVELTKKIQDLEEIIVDLDFKTKEYANNLGGNEKLESILKDRKLLEEIKVFNSKLLKLSEKVEKIEFKNQKPDEDILAEEFTQHVIDCDLDLNDISSILTAEKPQKLQEISTDKIEKAISKIMKSKLRNIELKINQKVDSEVLEELVKHLATREELKKMLKKRAASADDHKKVEEILENRLSEFKSSILREEKERYNSSNNSLNQTLKKEIKTFVLLTMERNEMPFQNNSANVKLESEYNLKNNIKDWADEYIQKITSEKFSDLEEQMEESKLNMLRNLKNYFEKEKEAMTIENEVETISKRLTREFDEKLFLVCSDLSSCKTLFQNQFTQPFYKCAQWIWKTGRLKMGSAVPWNIETVNTDQDNFRWEQDQVNIRITDAGLYEISFAFFTKCKPSVQLVVNGESVLSAIHSPSYVVHHSSGFVMDGQGHLEQGSATGLSLIVRFKNDDYFNN